MKNLTKFNICEVFWYYGEPLLFSHKNGPEDIYLCLALDENKSGNCEWICAKFNDEIWEQLYNKEIDICTAIDRASAALLYVKLDGNNKLVAQYIYNISSKLLPRPGVFLPKGIQYEEYIA